MWPFKHKTEPEEVLLPGPCECTHSRCCHKDGKGACSVTIVATNEFPFSGTCACQIYIRDDDDDDDDLEPETISPSELEKLYKR